MKPGADPETTESFLPLQPYEFQVLMVLTESDLHGYGIRRVAIERTNSKLRLDPGALYRTSRREMFSEIYRYEPESCGIAGRTRLGAATLRDVAMG